MNNVLIEPIIEPILKESKPKYIYCDSKLICTIIIISLSIIIIVIHFGFNN